MKHNFAQGTILVSSRKSNLECLRIIAIIMIIAYHYVVHSSFDFTATGWKSKAFLEFISYGGKAGVNIFCLLMGYFGIKSRFSVKKLVKIEEQILFYTVLGLLVYVLINRHMCSFFSLLQSIFPVVFGQYWFMTAYVIVYIMSPFLNKLLLLLDKESYIKLLILEIVLWGIIPFFTLQEATGMGFSQLIWFVVMYTFGGYIHLYKSKVSARNYFLAVLLCIATILIIVVGMNYVGLNNAMIFNHVTYFRWSNSPVIIIFSLSLFRLFEKWNMKNSKMINFLASGTLGIYLFHENIFIQPIIWQDIVNGKKIYDSVWIIVNSLAGIIFVFVVGEIVDFLQKKLSNRTEYIRMQISSLIERNFYRLVNNFVEPKRTK